MNAAPATAETTDKSPRKEPTIRRKQSGRRSKNIAELTPEEVQIGQKFALIQFTAMMDRRRAVVPMHVKRNVRNAIGSVLGRWSAEKARGTCTVAMGGHERGTQDDQGGVADDGRVSWHEHQTKKPCLAWTWPRTCSAVASASAAPKATSRSSAATSLTTCRAKVRACRQGGGGGQRRRSG